METLGLSDALLFQVAAQFGQNNLGAALRNQSVRTGGEAGAALEPEGARAHLEAALREFEAALRVFDPERMPYDFEKCTRIRDRVAGKLAGLR